MGITGRKIIFPALLALVGLWRFCSYGNIPTEDPYIRKIAALQKSGSQAQALSLLRDIPPSEEKAVIAWLEANVGKLEPLYLIQLSNKLAKTPGKLQEAAQWFYAGTIRTRMDSMRCSDPTAGTALELLGYHAPNLVKARSNLSERDELKAMQWAMAWDKAHPPAYSPIWVCYHGIEAFNKPPSLIPENDWIRLRDTYREKSAQALAVKAQRLDFMDQLKLNHVLYPYGSIADIPEGRAFPLAGNQLLMLDLRAPRKQFQTFDLKTAQSGVAGNFILPANEGGKEALSLAHSKILLAGGALTPLTNEPLYFFDPKDKTVHQTGSLNHLRSQHSATLLKDGTVLFAGGRTESIQYRNRQKTVLDAGTDQAEIYDPSTNQAVVVGALNHPRMNHSAILLDDGRVFIVGGVPKSITKKVDQIDTQTVEAYSPVAKTFQVVGRLNHKPDSSFNSSPLLVKLNDGAILVMSKNWAELFNSATGQSETLPNAAEDVFRNGEYASALVLPQGEVLIFGPESYRKGTSSLEIFDPKTKQFESVAEFAPQRLYTSLNLMRDGRVVLLGSAKEVLVFDPAEWERFKDKSQKAKSK